MDNVQLRGGYVVLCGEVNEGDFVVGDKVSQTVDEVSSF